MSVPGSDEPVARLVPAGYPPRYVSIIDYVLQSQIRGFFLALGLTTLGAEMKLGYEHRHRVGERYVPAATTVPDAPMEHVEGSR